MAKNSIKDIRNFFNTKDKPLSLSEMSEFWKSLTPAEQDYYKTADLSQ